MTKLEQERNGMDAGSINVQPTYDIINCGPRNRFWANGKLVHNSDNLNIQNLPSGRVDGQSNAMRMAIEAPMGSVVVASDSSQIEVRILAYIAQQIDLLSNFENKVDPYSAMASRIYGLPADVILNNHKLGVKDYTIMRQLGKASVLGCGYGMGVARFLDAARSNYGLDIDESLAQRAVEAYRQSNRAIVKLWKTCGTVLEDLIFGRSGTFGGPNSDLFYYGMRQLFNESIPGIRLPDGMWILYRNLRKEYVVDANTGKSKQEYRYDRYKNGRMQTSRIYSAMVVENLTQALAFSLLKRQAIKIAAKYPVAFNVHDEFAIVAPEAEAETAKAYLEECMSYTPKWLTGCPISCEASYAKQYGAC